MRSARITGGSLVDFWGIGMEMFWVRVVFQMFRHSDSRQQTADSRQQT